MCGRYDQKHDKLDYAMAMGWPVNRIKGDSQAEPRRNVSPGTYRPVMHFADGEPAINDLFWGYRPAWAASKKIPIANNARLEKITNGYWKKLMVGGRCIVPADGWYEWTGEKGAKQPWHIHLKTREPLFMAGVANFGEFVEHRAEAGFAIVTADALGGMIDVHDRRPVVLSAADAATWLNPNLPPDEAKHLLEIAARPPEDFEWYEVDPIVNNSRNEAPTMGDPISNQPPQS
jgi:putative SOS response-associated peptidase YedK